MEVLGNVTNGLLVIHIKLPELLKLKRDVCVEAEELQAIYHNECHIYFLLEQV